MSEPVHVLDVNDNLGHVVDHLLVEQIYERSITRIVEYSEEHLSGNPTESPIQRRNVFH